MNDILEYKTYYAEVHFNAEDEVFGRWQGRPPVPGDTVRPWQKASTPWSRRSSSPGVRVKPIASSACSYAARFPREHALDLDTHDLGPVGRRGHRAQPPAEPGSVPLAALGERPLVVLQRAVPPVRLGVAQKAEQLGQAVEVVIGQCRLEGVDRGRGVAISSGDLRGAGAGPGSARARSP